MAESLYKQICDSNLLLASWQIVQAKGSSGGIDGVTLQTFAADLDDNITALREELVAELFVPQPWKEVQIPKKDNEFRTLGLPSVRDKVVQQAARTLLEPLFDRMFLDVSYAYRTGKGAGRAIGRVQHLIVNEKRNWLTRCDIDRYFDNINHDRLMAMIAKRIQDPPFIKLLRTWLKMGRVDRQLHWTDASDGIPQGGIISPLLSNLYLNTLDHFCVDRKWGYVRYADDFVVLSHNRDEAERALTEIRGFLLNRLNLRLNPDSGVQAVADGFTFLGITFKGEERLVSDEKFASLKEKICQAVRHSVPIEIKSINETLQGIAIYYGKLLPERILEALDQVVCDALKEQTRLCRERGILASRTELTKIVQSVIFFSQMYKLRRTREVKEIVAFAHKREKQAVEEKERTPVIPRDPVRKRKRQYQRLEAAGFELVVSSAGAFVGKTQKGVMVKVKGQVVHQAPLNNLRHIMITAQGVSISSNLIAWAVEKRIPIDFIEHAGLPYARLSSFHATNIDLQRAQIVAETSGKASKLAMAFVHGKIRNQMSLIKYYHKYRKTFDEGFVIEFNDKLQRMERITAEIKVLIGDEHEILRGKLFSIEGRAAAAYWDVIKTLLDDEIVFEGRIGQGATDLVNSMLNYGYGILYAKVWQTVQRIGLNPYISFLHKSQNGKPTLIFDLIEEFRPQAVDRVVFSQINRGVEFKMEGTQLSLETRKILAEEVFARIHTVETFRGREMRLVEIMEEQARNIASFLLDETKRYSPYLAKW